MSKDPWQRIEYLIHNIRLSNGERVGSVGHFSRLLGAGPGENLYRIKWGRNAITRELAEAIHRLCPACSPEWLMTGRGEPPAPAALAILSVPVSAPRARAVPAGTSTPEDAVVPPFTGDAGGDELAFGAAAAGPWWPDKGPGEVPGSIVGRWELVESHHYFRDEQPARWVNFGERKSVGQPRFSWEFYGNGLMDEYEDVSKVATYAYCYDPRSRRLTIGVESLLVWALTEEWLVSIDWSGLALGDVSKDFYVRK